ncbi:MULTISPECIES: helix-turn-helix transcriptional regulator [unclassified Lentilitoribacter]|jgi:LuxR family quorum sensing-dependent transcriptional regulator|uniref:helix-turn-helix transcriptional regulator n=1 Tax=unclassified Lentilitoribacter TaxID=2647570 RepID=UPI0013A6A490|nr:LuxR family transcriptional regulator [Lentilitoribacter sp. Alg239-R112]
MIFDEGFLDKRVFVDSIIDAVAKIKSCENEAAVYDVLVQTAQIFGMTSFGISGIPLPGEDMRPYFMLNGWDVEWQARYINQGYVHTDPVIHRCTHSIEPFCWADATNGRKLSPNAQKIMNEARAFDMLYGFAIPIHSIKGQQAIVTFGTDHYDLSEEDEAALHMIAIYAHAQLRKFKRTATPEALPRDVSRITPREKECLLWASEGKTNDDVAEILSISRSMVETHLARAGSKLNTCGKTHLIAEAIRSGIIR